VIRDAVDASANIVGNVQRAVRPHCQSRGAMFRFRRRFHRSGETIRKYFAVAGSAVTGERLKDYVVTALRIGCSIP